MSFYNIAIDIEVGGQDYVKSSVVAIGVVVMLQNTQEKVDSLLVMLPCHIPTDGSLPAGFDQLTWDEFWTNPVKGDGTRTPRDLLLALQASHGISGSTEKECVKMVYDFISKYMSTSNTVIVTDNAAWDLGIMNMLLSRYNLPTLFYVSGKYKSLFDASNFAAGIARQPPSLGLRGNFKAACAKLGVPVKSANVPHDHNPVHDAEVIAFEASYLAFHCTTR